MSCIVPYYAALRQSDEARLPQKSGAGVTSRTIYTGHHKKITHPIISPQRQKLFELFVKHNEAFYFPIDGLRMIQGAYCQIEHIFQSDSIAPYTVDQHATMDACKSYQQLILYPQLHQLHCWLDPLNYILHQHQPDFGLS